MTNKEYGEAMMEFAKEVAAGDIRTIKVFSLMIACRGALLSSGDMDKKDMMEILDKGDRDLKISTN